MVVRRPPLPWPGPSERQDRCDFRIRQRGSRKGECGRPLIGTDVRGASGPGRRASTAQPLGKAFERYAILFQPTSGVIEE